MYSRIHANAKHKKDRLNLSKILQKGGDIIYKLMHTYMVSVCMNGAAVLIITI